MLEVQLADIWWCVRCVARGAWCVGCVVFAHILSCSMLEVQRAVRGARLPGTRCAARGARAWCVEEPLPVWRELRRRRPVCRWHRLLACCSQQGLIRPVLSGEGKGGERDGGVGEGEGEWRGGPGEALMLSLIPSARHSPPLFVFPSQRCSHRFLLSPPTHAHLAQFSSGQCFVLSSAQTSVLFSPASCPLIS